ncbi:DUF4129 domain-containing protein [Flavobacterium psychrotrophum]|uniref:DUF4129 domain-containing protein n=1 Tax=Flavobacterium psychrotrophum TaxID=2294119 RepID=UPI000E319ED7|nr:DUF4129 domain-containing protein [Flavobacterium psychrotrophum]
MTRIILLCIYLLFSSTALIAQEEADTISEIVTDSIQYSEQTDYSYTDDTVYQKQTVAPPLPATYTNRKFSPGFKKKYTGNDFDYEQKPETENWATRFFAWIRKILKMLFGPGNTQHAGKSSAIADWLIKSLWILVILVVVYFIARAVLQKNGLWIFGRADKKITVTDVEAGNIHEMDFASLIEKTKKEDNYRLALRYYYLWLLKKLSAREIITWNWDKTNTDYYYEIKNNGLRDDFRYLSYVYDHSWYGDFDIDEKAFAKAEKAFKKTLNTL